MKILIISQYYFPEQFQINEIAPELVKRGHEVTVLCGIPNYPKGVVFDGYENEEKVKDREREYFEKTGVRVIHVEQVPRGKIPISLIRNYISFARNSRKSGAMPDGRGNLEGVNALGRLLMELRAEFNPDCPLQKV